MWGADVPGWYSVFEVSDLMCMASPVIVGTFFFFYRKKKKKKFFVLENFNNY